MSNEHNANPSTAKDGAGSGKNKNHAEVIVIGSGPAGAAAAHRLVEAGVHVRPEFFQ